MLNDIVNIANQYAKGLEQVQSRKQQWIEKHEELKSHLKLVAETLNAQTTYKQGFFVDSLHAFDEEINGTCSGMQSLIFRSGDMPMQVAFCNDNGEKKEFTEHGFQITFTPMVTGEIIVLLMPHYSELNKTPPQITSLAIISNASELTMDDIDELLTRGLELAHSTSFTGIAAQKEVQENGKDTVNIPHHNPIGFKRYETTEKAKKL